MKDIGSSSLQRKYKKRLQGKESKGCSFGFYVCVNDFQQDVLLTNADQISKSSFLYKVFGNSEVKIF